MLQLTERYTGTSGHVNNRVKGLPASPGSFMSVNESCFRERHVFICVAATGVFINCEFSAEFVSLN